MKTTNKLILFYFLFIVSCSLFILLSCSHNPANYGESPTTGNIKITVDETFKTIIDDEVNVFEKIYIYAKIRPSYKPEIQTFNDLLNDSVKLIVASRKLTKKRRIILTARNYFRKRQR